MSNKITIQGKIHALGDVEYADDGGTVRGVLIELHADDVRKIGGAGLLFADVRITMETREPGEGE